MKNDLTQGVIWKKILIYFFPLALGTIFQQLYNAVDGIIVGKYVGTIALASVGGSAFMINQTMISFFVGLSGGATVLISQYFGARNYEKLEDTVHTSLLFSAILGLLMGLLGYLMTPSFLQWMKTPAESLPDSIAYLRIIFAGVVFQMVYNMAAGILRAVGNSRDPFIYLAVCCVLNILFDIIAVVILQWGVAGAAMATVFAQALCCVISVWKLQSCKGEPFALVFSKLRIQGKVLYNMLRVGLPIALQSVMYNTTNILIQVGVNSLGTVTVASWAVLNKMDGFFWGLMSSANVAVSTFVGQNFGKGDFHRVRKGVRSSMIIFEGVAVGFALLFYSTIHFTIPLFSKDAEVIAMTGQISKCFVPFYFIWVVNEVLGGALRGEGATFVPFCIAALSGCVFRITWVETVFRLYPNIFVLSSSYPLSWVIASTGTFIYYVLHTRKRNLSQKI